MKLKLPGRKARRNDNTDRADRPSHPARKGQTLVVIALTMTLLILFIGLAIDGGNLMGKKAKLQSAVDSSALSAALTLVGDSVVTSTTIAQAYMVLEVNGVPSSTLASRRVDFPGVNQVRVRAVQRVQTYFMGLIPAWRTVNIDAESTADVNAYAEITAKPYGKPGVVNELNLMVWGVDSWRRGGDAYSPRNIGGAAGSNPEYPKMPYGYLYRIDVPPGYSSNRLLVEVFDPDTYNRTGVPPAWPTPRAGTPTATPAPDAYASCSNPRPGDCTSGNARWDTGLKLNAFPSGRPAFWRVDENRNPWTASDIGPSDYQSSRSTNTQFTLWHFDPRITSAFGNPTTLSDQPGGAYLARYTVQEDTSTDLSWYRPPGFDIQLRDAAGNSRFQREANGGLYFYLYVRGVGGSSENNFDLRVGPPQAAYDCSTASNCYVNRQYALGAPDWTTGGAQIFAKRALPLNLVTGASFPMLYTQVSKFAAGQTLGVRHFDQDCNGGCGSVMTYQMQRCGCTDLLNDSCWQDVAQGWVGGNNAWDDGVHDDPELVRIPMEGTPEYDTFFGAASQCDTSWLRMRRYPSYSGDTTVWEMPYIQPRIIR